MDDVSPWQSTQSPCTQQVLAGVGGWGVGEVGVSLPKIKGSPNHGMAASFKHLIYM